MKKIKCKLLSWILPFIFISISNANRSIFNSHAESQKSVALHFVAPIQVGISFLPGQWEHCIKLTQSSFPFSIHACSTDTLLPEEWGGTERESGHALSYLSLSLSVIFFSTSGWITLGSNMRGKGYSRLPWSLLLLVCRSLLFASKPDLVQMDSVASWGSWLFIYSVEDGAGFSLGSTGILCSWGIPSWYPMWTGELDTVGSSAHNMLHCPIKLHLKAQVQKHNH